MNPTADRAMTSTPSFGLYRDAWGRLGLIDSDGRRHAEVEVLRMFPLSDAERWIAICDHEGHEIAAIEDPQQLPAEVRRTLQEELADRHFLPQITRILDVSPDTHPCQWQVQTTRGPTLFELASEDDVRALGPSKAVIADSNGIRYLVPDIRALDAGSRRILERYL